ncbi:MAG: FapA family protein [Glaciecola sp.]
MSSGIEFKTHKNGSVLFVVFEPLLITGTVDAKVLINAVQKSAYANYKINDNDVLDACALLTTRLSNNNMDPIDFIIGETKDAELDVIITADKMHAELVITAAYSGYTPNLSETISLLNEQEVHRGISQKRVQTLLNEANQAKPGLVCSAVIAKGLPAKAGKNSYLKPMLPNVYERILTPQTIENGKVDMREFGDILCVNANDIVAKRIAPTPGRTGFTVTNEILEATPGAWKKIRMGKNVYIPDSHENTVLAEIDGLPKFMNNKISVDDVLVTKGVNVATGNIKYSGSIIVNGDVAEKMLIQSDGDITINGFVESARVEAGGDIIITQGASGKMNETDCQLIAKGSLYLEHGQGLDIDTGVDLTIAKQLAYSNVICRGKVTVGRLPTPNGKVFASTIKCFGGLSAGHVGAVSGSELNLDFSQGYEMLSNKLDSMLSMFKELSTKNADHEIKVSQINNKKPKSKFKAQVDKLNEELELERVFLNWLRLNMEEIRTRTQNYEKNATINIGHTLYPGVTVKLRNSSWRVQKEFAKGSVIRENDKWVYTSIY